jgi:acyl-coenzyme A thioesterase PaaI-like protein
MAFSNRITRVLDRLGFLPEGLRWWAFTLAFGRIVPFVATGRVRIERAAETEAVLSLANRRQVQNHIKGVHAAAVALLAETATGLLVGLNIPDSAVPLLKTLHIDYTKRAHGGLRAVATLTPEQIAHMRTEDKGEVTVPVTITDEEGGQPVKCQMVWAWIPRARKG